MKVILTCDRVLQYGAIQLEDEVIDVEDAEGLRMIFGGLALPYVDRAEETPERKESKKLETRKRK